MNEIYVGNLLYSVTNEDLQMLFAPYGAVYSITIITEVEPKHPHAYAFVEMADEDAEKAIRMLDGVEFFGRTLRVEGARPEQVAGGIAG
jgi:RNA recognition motif-containing protein